MSGWLIYPLTFNITYTHCRYDWYQTETDIIIAIMVKNASQDDVQIDFTEKTVQDVCTYEVFEVIPMLESSSSAVV